MRINKIAFVQCPVYAKDAPPIGIAYLSSFLRREGYKTKVFDFNIELYNKARDKKWWDRYYFKNEHANSLRFFEFFSGNTFLELANRVLVYDPEAVCFSVQSTSLLFSVKVAKKIKELNQKKLIIFGGPATFEMFTEEIYQFADVIVECEGEKALLSIFNHLKKNKKLDHSRDFIIKKHGKARIIQGRLIKNLDLLPIPDYSEFDLKAYTKHELGVIRIMGSKGCINKCVFCDNPMLGQGYRARSNKSLLKEFRLRKKQGFKHLLFVDDAFNLDTNKLSDLCDSLIKERLDITWGASACINSKMNFKLLRRMKRSGCRSLVYGVESVSKKVLNQMQKQVSFTDICKQVIKTRLAGIKVYLNFIIGFPNEKGHDFLKMLLFIVLFRPFINGVSGSPCRMKHSSFMGKYPERFNVVDESKGGHSGLRWSTKDKKNTWDVRKRRNDVFHAVKRLLFYNRQY